MTPRLRSIVRLAALALLALPVAAEPAVEITVFKSPRCGCCVKWAEHLEANGFRVVTEDRTDMRALKRRHGVPGALESCHTALVEGYVIEGHVPASDVARLLRERPGLVGLAVPGMPIGSPGMEGPDPERYSVISFDATGGRQVYSTHGP